MAPRIVYSRAILDGATGDFEVHRTTNFTAAAAMTQLEGRANEDQPYVQATTVMGGADVGKDRVYIGVNDFNAAGGKTATIEQTLDGGVAAPTFSSVRVEKRADFGQNGPQVRPAIHGDGTIYAAFYRWISSSGSFPANTLVMTNAELIVVRDDDWGQGANALHRADGPIRRARRPARRDRLSPSRSTGPASRPTARSAGAATSASPSIRAAARPSMWPSRPLVGGTYTLRLVRSTRPRRHMVGRVAVRRERQEPGASR